MRKLKYLLLGLALCVGASARALSPAIRLVDAFPGVSFDRPLFAAQPPDATARMFVVEQNGRVAVVDYPAPAPPAAAARREFLDIRARVSRIGNEEGLLGFAFHPGYAANGKFYVHYSAKYLDVGNRRNVLSEMTVDASDPDRADAASERVIMSIPQPYENHNGGWIGFGADGMLYVALGDGGSGGDPLGKGQSLATRLGKILRIDVDGAHPYAVPTDNPFVARAGALPEIWAYGLRNPWRCSFDRATGDLWTGDVGQDRYEEVDRIVGGGNYGWNRKEGFADYAPVAAPPADPLIPPLASYNHSAGESITGGYVYRGAAIPSLVGSYLYADFLSGTIWSLRAKAGVAWPPAVKDDAEVVEVLRTVEQIASFGEDRDGELVVCSFGGSVLALVSTDDPPPVGPFTYRLGGLGVFTDLRRLRPAPGALRYAVRSPLWSDGAAKDRFVLLPPGTSMTYAAEDAFDVPVGAKIVKTFSLRGRRLETRVILRTEEGFDAATYRWLDDRSDATLVTERETAEIRGGRTWTFPSPTDCRRCHTDVAGFVLGLRSRQVAPTNGGRDRLALWSKSGALSGAAPPLAGRPIDRGIRGGGPLSERVRGYLDANCAFCHQPGAAEDGGALDLRAATPLAATGLIDETPQHGDLSLEDARVVAKGAPERSVLYERMRRRGEGQMPSLASGTPDAAALKAVARWIRSLR